MSFKDLRGFVDRLEKEGELVRIKEELSTEYEIPAAIKHVARYEGQAVLFEKVKGYDTPIVGNLLGSQRRLAMAFGVKEDQLEEAYMARVQNPVKPKMVRQAPVQEVFVDSDIDICRTIPVLTHHEKDAGPYMTSAITVAKDPETGIRGMGLHRIQVKDKDTIGILLATPPLSYFLTKADQQDTPLEIAVVSGADPLTFCAGVFFAPEGVDKFDIAGGFAQAPVELVKCHTVDVEVPANAEFVLEGYLIPRRREKEGPFGESTGYYLAYNSPVFKIKAISHRAKTLYHALMPFDAEEEVIMGMMMLPHKLGAIQKALPQVEVRKMKMRATGEICIVQIDKRSDQDSLKVIDHLLSDTATKIVVVVDGDVDISDLNEVAWAVATRVRPDRDIAIKPDLPGMTIDPSVAGVELEPDVLRQPGITAKVGIDATKPLKELERFERIDVPAAVKQKISRLMGRSG